ncbi:MAG: hypothetical protein K1X36_02920 [Pyrinomonadaceae bacterium]|nr:hypothetical protein [Pyrinomonadaceae bacterium]
MKKTITTFVLAAILMIGSSAAFAGDGIIIAGLANDPCVQNDNTAKTGTTSSSKDGIIIAGFTGIIIAGFTGIIIAGFGEGKDEAPVNCGIIIAG